MNIIIAITGATGVVYGIRLLEVLKETKHKRHLVISPWGEKNIKIETDYTIKKVKSLATYNYSYYNLGALIASGSFLSDAMIVIPCSMKTLSAIASGYTDNLINRAVDVILKEKRKLIIVPRETPLNIIHLQNMITVANVGGIILPPIPAFYYNPKSVDDVINHTIGKILDQLNIKNEFFFRWRGVEI